MSNRTDWPELVNEIMEIYGLEDKLMKDHIALSARLEDALCEAFVAGQESKASSRDSEIESLCREIKKVRAEYHSKGGGVANTAEHPSLDPYKKRMSAIGKRLNELTLHQCGPSTTLCKCSCPDGDCEHVWDGPEEVER